MHILIGIIVVWIVWKILCCMFGGAFDSQPTEVQIETAQKIYDDWGV